MNTTTWQRVLSFVLVLLWATWSVVHAQPAASGAPPAMSAAAENQPASDEDEFTESPSDEPRSTESPDADSRHAKRAHHRTHREGNDVVSVGHDSHVSAGERAESVVSVFGSSTSEGEAGDVVAVFGNVHVTGPVHDDVVAVLGNLYIDSKVEGDAVAVLGTVELGPHAEIMGDVTAVLGSLRRAPESIIHGDVHDVFVGDYGDLDGLHRWIHRCLFEGRPLAFVSGIGWAWSIAFVFLVFYVFLALLFPSAISRCVITLETHPGPSALAALLTVLFSPVLIVLLIVTVIGMAAAPFVMMILFLISLFGKAVILAWMGHKVAGLRASSPRGGGYGGIGAPSGAASQPSIAAQGATGVGALAVGHPVIAVLIGGAIAMLLYTIPGLGFLAYKALGFFGVGAVVYTLLVAQRARQTLKTADAAAKTDAGSAAGFAGGVGVAAGSGTAGGADMAAGAGTTGAPGDAHAAWATGESSSSSAAAGARAESASHMAAGLPRAGFWLRMGALAIDVLLIGFLTQSGSHVLGSSHHDSNLHLLVLATYGACMWKLRGSTVGGIVCDLRVVRLDGRPVAWETAIVRALGCFLSLAVVGLGFIWIAFDENHQAWHDKIAGTVVVRVPKGKPLV